MGLLKADPEQRTNVYQAIAHDAFLTYSNVVEMKKKIKENEEESAKNNRKYSFNIKTLKSMNKFLDKRDSLGERMSKQETISSQQLSTDNSIFVQETNSEFNFKKDSFDNALSQTNTIPFEKAESEEEKSRNELNFNKRRNTHLPSIMRGGRQNRRLKKSVFYQQTQIDIYK